MSVEIDSSSAVSEGATAERLFNLTNAAGSSIEVNVSTFGGTPSSVTYGGDACSSRIAVTNSEDDRAHIYARTPVDGSVATGSNNVDVDFAGSTEAVCFAFSLTGEDAADPIMDTDSIAVNTSATSATLASMSSANDGRCFAAMAWFGDRTMNANLGQTSQYAENNTTAQESGCGSTEPGADAGVVMGYTWTGGTRVALVGISWRPSAGGGSTVDDGELSAQGTGAMTMAGASISAAAFSMSGTGTLTMRGAAISAAAMNAQGTGAMTMAGASTVSSALNAAGAAAVEFTGASLAAGDGVFSMAGESTVGFEGASIAAAELSAAGEGAASFVAEAGAPAEEEAPQATPGGGPGAWARSSSKHRRRLKREDEELDQLLRAMAPRLMHSRRTLH